MGVGHTLCVGTFTELICAASIPAERRGEPDSQHSKYGTPVTWMRM
jgi:hypothetical protein